MQNVKIRINRLALQTLSFFCFTIMMSCQQKQVETEVQNEVDSIKINLPKKTKVHSTKGMTIVYWEKASEEIKIPLKKQKLRNAKISGVNFMYVGSKVILTLKELNDTGVDSIAVEAIQKMIDKLILYRNLSNDISVKSAELGVSAGIALSSMLASNPDDHSDDNGYDGNDDVDDNNQQSEDLGKKFGNSVKGLYHEMKFLSSLLISMNNNLHSTRKLLVRKYKYNFSEVKISDDNVILIKPNSIFPSKNKY